MTKEDDVEDAEALPPGPAVSDSSLLENSTLGFCSFNKPKGPIPRKKGEFENCLPPEIWWVSVGITFKKSNEIICIV